MYDIKFVERAVKDLADGFRHSYISSEDIATSFNADTYYSRHWNGGWCRPSYYDEFLNEEGRSLFELMESYGRFTDRNEALVAFKKQMEPIPEKEKDIDQEELMKLLNT